MPESKIIPIPIRFLSPTVYFQLLCAFMQSRIHIPTSAAFRNAINLTMYLSYSSKTRAVGVIASLFTVLKLQLSDHFSRVISYYCHCRCSSSQRLISRQERLSLFSSFLPPLLLSRLPPSKLN